MKPTRHTLPAWVNRHNLPILLFFAILLAGALGWQLSPAPNPPPAGWQAWCDDVYRALQLFVLNYDHPGDAPWHPDPLLNITRFVAPLFLAIALITRLSGHVRNGLLYAWHARPWAGPQYLIIGYGRIGQGLASALQTKGTRVVAVDHRVTPLDQQSARLAGIELYEADAQDLNSFKNVPVRLKSMRRILVSVNNGQQTIATAASLAEQIGQDHGSIWMQLNDWTLLDRLRNSSMLAETDHSAPRKIRSFSMAEAIGTQLVAKYRPALLATAFGQNRLHAVLVRFDDFVWAMAETLILNGTTPPPRLARPRLTIIDAKAEELAARWRARHPYLHQWADISFKPAEPGALAWSAAAPLLTEIETLDPPTLYIFGRSGDGDSLSDALALRHGMEKGLRQPAPVFLTTEVQGVHMFGLRENCENLQDRLHVIGGDTETVAYSHVVDPWFEQVALRFFRNYNQVVDDITAKRRYDADPETKQVSNRRAAVHAVQILAWLGFAQVKATEPNFGLNGKAVQALMSLLAHNVPDMNATYLNRWGLYEHMRWCVDRAIDGWRQGARDNEARFRDQMERGRYDYEALSLKDQALDYDQAKGLTELLSSPPPPLNDPDPLWFRHDATKDFVRMMEHEPPLHLQWHSHDGALSLHLADAQYWPAPPDAPGLHKRVRLLVPGTPKLDLTPSQQKAQRLAAYKDFIAKLPTSDRLHFRFLRVRGEGWEWLPKGSSGPADAVPTRIDGCTLPPLTIGFAGARNLEPYGGVAAVRARVSEQLHAVLQAQSANGRPLRLITGVAKGADQIMIKLWRHTTETRNHPILALVPDHNNPQTIGTSGAGITELLLHGGQQDNGALRHACSASESVKDPMVFVEISERILNSCDLLITLYDETVTEHDGGTKQTIRHADILQIKVIKIPLTAGV